MFRWALVGILLSAGISSADAGSQLSLQDFDAASRFDQALVAVDGIRARKKLECVLATAKWAFCGCLSQKLPLDTFPRSYPAIAKQEAEYEQMSDADRGIVRQCISDTR
jgi:hypothetical protein